MQPKYITVHCSATNTQDIGVAEIRHWHVKGNGWSDIGYHYVIRRDGTLEVGRSISRTGAHVKGHNRDNIGVCLIGGVDSSGKPENNFTEEQFKTLHTVITLLKNTYDIPLKDIKGHRDWGANKACPSFDVSDKIQEWGMK